MTLKLADILRPVGLHTLLETHWGKSSLHLANDQDRYRDLFSWQSLNEVLATLRVPHPSVLLFKAGSQIAYKSPLDIIREVDNGASLIVENIDHYDSRLRSFADRAAFDLGFPVRFNLYLSHPAAKAYLSHYDTQNFLIFQIAGAKKWRLYRNQADRPLYVQQRHESLNPATLELEQELTLKTGDCLFVPHGQWHDATAAGKLSMHLTLALFAPTGIDLLNWLADELRADPECRRVLPVGGNQQSLHDAIAKAADVFARYAQQPDISARFLNHQLATRHNRTLFEFPHHASILTQRIDNKVFQLKDISQGLALPTSNHDEPRWLAAGVAITLDRSLVDVITDISKREPFRIDDLLNEHPTVEPTALKELLVTLLRYGLVKLL